MTEKIKQLEMNWMNLSDIAEIVERVDLQGEAFAANASAPSPADGCEAMPDYLEAYGDLVETVQLAMDAVDAYTGEILEELAQEIEKFSYLKMQAIANCSKKDCPDRDTAREDLGWQDDLQMLQ